MRWVPFFFLFVTHLADEGPVGDISGSVAGSVLLADELHGVCTLDSVPYSLGEASEFVFVCC